MSRFTAFQEQAIRAEGNVLVSAGAGTGKTGTVVQRCLRLLIEEGQSIESILMVTFTEAAAAEMRARLRKRLEEARAQAEPGPAGRLEEQLALLDTAHIATLHGFCLQLIREHFHELGLDPQVLVLDETQSQPLIHATLDQVLAQCYERAVPHAEAALELIRNYGGGSEEKIRGLILKLHRYTQTLPDPRSWMEHEAARLEAASPSGWSELFEEAFRSWRLEWEPEFAQPGDVPNVQRCHRALASCPARPTLAEGRAVLAEILAADEMDWPRGTKTTLRAALSKFFAEAEFLLSAIRDEASMQADWERFRQPMRALLELTREFTREFTRAKRALGGVDFADLEQLALACLHDENGRPSAAARLWQERFAHVFVDECQDINAAQDAIIRAVSRGAGGGSGNRFLVGDVKQSIYRFRLADPTIFRKCEEAWREGNGGLRIPLADNFRSREAVLNFVNPLFAALMRESIGGVRYDEDAWLRFGNPEGRSTLGVAGDSTRRVELHVLHRGESEAAPGPDSDADVAPESAETGREIVDLDGAEAEARLVAGRLRALKAGQHPIWDPEEERIRAVEWRDMVVLLRSPGARVEAFAKEFARAGVPLAAARPGFFSALEVRDLLNLLSLLDNPLQDIPLVAVLRSPLFGFSADELAAIRASAPAEGNFFRSLQKFHASTAPLAAGSPGESSREKVAGFYATLARWRSLVRHTSLSQCLEAALADTEYEAQLRAGPRGLECLANVQRLLELARNYDPFQRQGLYRFLRFVREQQEAGLEQDVAATESGQAVRLMSIHRSKGLEFPVVVVAGLAGQFNQRDLNEDILLSPRFGLCGKILCPQSGRRYPSLPWWLARKREKLELLGEEMRLLYVALTRARDTLVLTAMDSSRPGQERWACAGGEAISDRELLSARSYWDWLRTWLRTISREEEWSSDHSGQNSLPAWRRWLVSDLPSSVNSLGENGSTGGSSIPPAGALPELQARLRWSYPWPMANVEAAKSNVSVLRRRQVEEDGEARPLFHPKRVVSAGLGAAQVGSAHHTFLQFVRLDRTSGLVELRNEAERLREAGLLSTDEVAALDFPALAGFWQSSLGRHLVAARDQVHRELPFTARFTPAQLRELGISVRDGASDDFIVVQGVVDLALLAPDGLLILDFKTDSIRASELPAKVATYAPQLRLYASALSRTYRRPVKQLALHFLALGETVAISEK